MVNITSLQNLKMLMVTRKMLHFKPIWKRLTQLQLQMLKTIEFSSLKEVEVATADDATKAGAKAEAQLKL